MLGLALSKLPNMSNPSDEALESWIEDCVAHLRDSEGYNVAQPHANEFLLLYGVIARTVRYADAYLHLLRDGFGSEAVVLARASLEHAVTLQWVFMTQGGIDRFRVTFAHERQEHFSNLAEWLPNAGLADELKKLGPPPNGPRLPPFMNMLRELDSDKFLETSYHILSQQVHVTHAAVTSFIEPGKEEELHVKYDQEYGYRHEATYVVAAACMFARWVVARLTNDKSLLAMLDKTSDDLIVPMTLLDRVAPGKRRKGL